jgi:aspartyl-tRNA(Asn)/glutamyl-tRNA(Gln) amidotransferase subunit C
MLSDADIQRIATLARLRVPPEELAATREKLGAVVAYVEQLQKLDLNGVEPLAHVGDAFNRLDADVARAAMPWEQLGAIAPATHEETTPGGTDLFVQIPKVIKKDGSGGAGGGA